MSLKLTHVIEFVADMDSAVRFYRDVIGLPLKFQSPGWSELRHRRDEPRAASGV